MKQPCSLFDFRTLDDIAFAAERGRLDGRVPPDRKARDIGPILELSQLSEGGSLTSPKFTRWLDLGGLWPFVKQFEDGNRMWICPRTRRIGFLRTTPKFLDDETIWTDFCLTVQRAAQSANFSKSLARQLTAALRELHSNIYEHSQAHETGLVAFQARQGRFEFLVADDGVGILNSLRACPDYTGLSDHGEALRLALTQGVSRHGPDCGRGYGFQPIFVGLANLHGTLRFRSGDHALLIDGRSPSLVSARIAQKPTLQGFLVSVTCKTSTSTSKKM